MKQQVESFEKERENLEKASQQLKDELDKCNETINDYERQIAILRRHNDELDTQIKTSQAKILTLENEIATQKGENQRLSETNQRLQSEKQKITE